MTEGAVPRSGSGWIGLACACLFLAAAPAASAAQLGATPVQVPGDAELMDPIAVLQRAIDSGGVHLDFHPDRGYIDAVMSALDVPFASQTLVFSKTSFQADLISPDNPRALYFNDDVYAAWVPGGRVLEFVSIDPRYGTQFYTMEQIRTETPRFEREGARCINCHLPTRSDVPIPRLTVMSVVPNEAGEALGSNILVTTDRSPVGFRWGGWLATGARGDAHHMANFVLARSGNERVDIDAGSHLRSLDTGPAAFLAENGSDVAALMLLAHQAEVHNRIGEAAFTVRALEAASRGGVLSERALEQVEEAVEPLVREMLFVDAAPLEGIGSADSPYARAFAAPGPRDGAGRSLRDLDLETRLLRYPLSYLVYTDAFDELPDRARDYAYGRFLEVLEGEDSSAAFAHLSDPDREAVLEILIDTKPSFRNWIASR